MGGHVTIDHTTPLPFTQADETWIVDPGVSVAVATGNAVFSARLNSHADQQRPDLR